MNKKAVAIALAAMMTIPLCACSDEEAGDVDIKDVVRVNPVSAVSETGDLAMGDVMPFFDGTRFNIYHLQNKTGSSSMWYHPIACVSTADFVHYEETGVALDFEEYFDSYDAALGTGSFIRDEDGRVHCFYTGHNAELSPVEVIRHAVSLDDQKTWIKDGNFYMQNGENDFRDPYLYYDEATKKYNMLVTTRKGGTGVIERYTADSLSAYPSEWRRDNTTFFTNDAGTYNMECPSYFVYKGVYYLMYSEQGEQRVTHYRYKTSADSPWIRPAIDYIDGQGFYAGRPEMSADGELYCFAWCAKTTTGDDTGDFDWAGNLVVHKLEQKQNGELYPVMVPGVRAATATQTGGIGDISFDGGFSERTVGQLGGGVTRMSFSFTLGDKGGDIGLTFGLKDGGNNRLGNAVVSFNAKTGAFSYYNDVFSNKRYRKPLVTTPFAFETNKKYDADVIIDGQILSVYLSGELAVTARVYGMPGKSFGFYANGATAEITDIKLYA